MLEPQNLIEYDMSGAMQTTFASPPLEGPLEITGSPIVEVYLASDTPHRDVDLFAYLVCHRAGSGTSYLTEGCLKATHRNETRDTRSRAQRHLQECSRPQGWVPYHSHSRRHRQYLPEVSNVQQEPAPVLLRFALLPTSVKLCAGDRLGLLFTGCDLKHFLVEFKEWPFHIHTGGQHSTQLLLPRAHGVVQAPTHRELLLEEQRLEEQRLEQEVAAGAAV